MQQQQQSTCSGRGNRRQVSAESELGRLRAVALSAAKALARTRAANKQRLTAAAARLFGGGGAAGGERGGGQAAACGGCILIGGV